MPKSARWLGLSGLLPLVAVVTVLIIDDDPENRNTMAMLGLAYAALILSFLGGLWWGLAAASAASVPPWVWVAAVAPSLYAWLPLGLAALGLWPASTALATIGIGLWLALPIDKAMVAARLAPPWWMPLRWPLSLGLGALCLAAAAAL